MSLKSQNALFRYEICLDKHLDLNNNVKYIFYHLYFKENVDSRFGYPQVDVFCTCESLPSKLRDRRLCESANRSVIEEMTVHINRANNYYKAKKVASNNKYD